ncbi:MAG: hypothetical protein IPM23_27240 [Candidatus Melainabacteria bacterium]|nr:hypothetical protein [Candidatus Melainabacteria bacterium]
MPALNRTVVAVSIEKLSSFFERIEQYEIVIGNQIHIIRFDTSQRLTQLLGIGDPGKMRYLTSDGTSRESIGWVDESATMIESATGW